MKTRDLRQPLDTAWLHRELRKVLAGLSRKTWCQNTWARHPDGRGVSCHKTRAVLEAERRCLMGHVLAAAHAQGHFVTSYEILSIDQNFVGEVIRINDDAGSLAEVRSRIRDLLAK